MEDICVLISLINTSSNVDLLKELLKNSRLAKDFEMARLINRKIIELSLSKN